MTISQITRNLAGAAALLALAAGAKGALAAEKLFATDASVRTILSFKVPEAAAQKLLPEGWQVSPPTTGPSRDANLKSSSSTCSRCKIRTAPLGNPSASRL